MVDLINGNEDIPNWVVEPERIEELGGTVVPGASSLGGLLSSLARFHTNDNAKRSVSAFGLFVCLLYKCQEIKMLS